MTLPAAIHLDTGVRPGVRHERWALCGATGWTVKKTGNIREVTCVNCIRREQKRARRAKEKR